MINKELSPMSFYFSYSLVNIVYSSLFLLLDLGPC